MTAQNEEKIRETFGQWLYREYGMMDNVSTARMCLAWQAAIAQGEQELKQHVKGDKHEQ